MSQLSVPTVELEAEVLMADGRRLLGKVFLPSGAPRHSGAERPQEWIDDGRSFLPFLPQGGASAVLLNKQTLISLTVAAQSDQSDAPEPGSGHEVLVSLGSLELRGWLRVDLPAHQNRVLDLLNAPETFLLLIDGDRHHLVRKSAILHVVQIRRD
jgi:hypothetical protein